ncbi:hypothetical protein TNCV_358871 [Trichonephila clavipes]|nr:hypothetical protein TNCV_358871 [Trichonephila clavipes]
MFRWWIHPCDGCKEVMKIVIHQLVTVRSPPHIFRKVRIKLTLDVRFMKALFNCRSGAFNGIEQFCWNGDRVNLSAEENSRTTFLRSDWPRPFARREVGVEMELGRSENKRPEQGDLELKFRGSHAKIGEKTNFE